MTDGTTGIQVAPITEDEMNQVQSILKRAIDGVVGMSQLKADVDMLRETVRGLQADADRLRNANEALDQALTKVRNERDAAQAELVEAQAKADRATRLEAENADLRSQLDQAKRERDDHGMRTLELEESLKEAHLKLEAIRDTFVKAFGQTPAMQPTSPKPVPEEPFTQASFNDPPKPKNYTDRYLPDGSVNPDYIPF